MTSLRYKVAIVGASETTDLGVIPELGTDQLAVDAAVNAIKDCGIDKDQIDGIASNVATALSRTGHSQLRRRRALPV